jgi:D-alanine-D-alanine ligase-like ATP-grasp enzyme
VTQPRRIRKVLVANRGEIAVRVLRTCQEMGLRTVAVYSDADRGALHVRKADEAVHLGPSPARESYLSIERLLDAAKKTGADAIHPGYGFLSERAELARAVEAAGLTFVGPRPEAMEIMGEKTSARARMRAAGVPVVPGSDGPLPDEAAALAAAEGLGWPVMVKAVAGGGGRGMKRVERAADLPAAWRSAQREAQAAFGDGQLYLEKAIDRARHVEVQVFCDEHGGAIHLGERDCSVQRRHQKVVEESPSPFVDPPLRAALCEVALAAARAVGYRGAGTWSSWWARPALVPGDEHPARWSTRSPSSSPASTWCACSSRWPRVAGCRRRRPSPSAATPSRRGSAPRTRPAASCPARARSPTSGSRAARASATTGVSTAASWSRPTTTRCSASSRPGPRRATRRWRGWRGPSPTT